jgi:hypothetical protein
MDNNKKTKKQTLKEYFGFGAFQSKSRRSNKCDT